MKRVMDEANKQIAYLMEKLREEPRKATLHMRKIMKKFDKKTEEDIEIAMPADLQEWCRQAKELQMLWADKENHDKKGSRFWKLNKVNEEAVQANLKSDF